MSRSYSMQLRVSGYDPQKLAAVKQAAEAEWPFGDWLDDDDEIAAFGDGQLAGGETEGEFADRLALAVWRAHGGPCKVAVHCTFLEDLPCESFYLDEDEYRQVMADS